LGSICSRHLAGRKGKSWGEQTGADGSRSLPMSVMAASMGWVPGPSHARGDDASVPQQARDARGEAPGEICWVSGACGVVPPNAVCEGMDAGRVLGDAKMKAL
ncbi:unnamed protein product, partial [Bubo scandiacus]